MRGLFFWLDGKFLASSTADLDLWDTITAFQF